VFTQEYNHCHESVLYHMLECMGKVYVTAEWLGTKIVEVNETHFIFYTLCSTGTQFSTQTEVRRCQKYYIVHAYVCPNMFITIS